MSLVVGGDGLFSGNETADIIDGDFEDIRTSGDICGLSGLGDLGILADIGVCSSICDLSVKLNHF